MRLFLFLLLIFLMAMTSVSVSGFYQESPDVVQEQSVEEYHEIFEEDAAFFSMTGLLSLKLKSLLTHSKSLASLKPIRNVLKRPPKFLV